MEQKRTLCIVLASGIFLAVVLLTAMILWSPNKVSSQKNEYPRPPMEKTEKIKREKKDKPLPPPPLPGMEEGFVPGELEINSAETTLTTDNLTVISNGTTTIYGYAPVEETPVAEEPKVIENRINEEKVTTIELDTQVVKPTNSYTETKVQQAKTENKIVEKTPAHAKTEVKSVTKVAPKTTSTSATTTAKKVETPAQVPDRFWVQVVSYTSKNAAEEARQVLIDNKIQCELFTYTDAKGKLYYRVRVGPYTTKAEAEYWKNRIDQIPMFAKSGSYITNTSASK